MDPSLNSKLFQRPAKSKKITLRNPSTGIDVEFPETSDGNGRGIPTKPIELSKASGRTRAQLQAQLSKTRARGTARNPEAVEAPTQGVKSEPKNDGTDKSSAHFKHAKTLSEVNVRPVQLNDSKQRSPSDSSNGKPKSEGISKSCENTIGRKPDVYAQSYVPAAFLAVNAAPAILLTSTPVRAIDFAAFTSTFAGSLLLPPLPSLTAPAYDGGAAVESIYNLQIDNYEQHLSDCLVLDLEAQVPEIRAYDLFGVPLSVIDRHQETYALSVPGLRENTPRVAFGDNLLVRQLIMDPATRLPMAPPASGSTGYQISAVVIGVDRQKESVNLRINGFTPHLQVCNVCFIVQTRWIKSLQRAVSSMANALGAASQYEKTTDGELQLSGTKSSTPEQDFGAIGTPVKSPPIKTVRQDYFGSVRSPSRKLDSPRIDYMAVTTPIVRDVRPDRRDGLGFAGPTPWASSDTSRPTIESQHRNSTYNTRHDSLVTYNSQSWLRRMLFPTDSDGVTQRSLPQGVFMRSWFDRLLNHEQKKAVDNVLTKSYGSIPFLINGPPGTGKTKTIVEVVTHLALDPEHFGAILLCAPSDSAADTLALRLRQHLEPKVMFRLNDFSRTFAEVPQELLPYCYIQGDIFSLPPLPELLTCKVVITTCRTADVLVQARITNRDIVTLHNNTIDTLNYQHAKSRQVKRSSHLHWTALPADEAAQATEPELLIPLSVVTPPTSCISEPDPRFVMAGDQHQLGPRTYDKSTSLHVSLFERLSGRSLYADHPLARKSYRRLDQHAPMLRPAFVNLTRNYRSHPAILALPSALFYSDTLIPEALNTDQLETWPGWQGRRWPVLFACNGGIDDCEDIKIVGGGWYNIREARKAIAFAKDLLESGHIEQEKEICIMSPFRAQVNVLRKMARKAGFWGLNIGPMDAFQGLESRFVIICTTRARSRFLEDDALKGAGIVNEPKKFNVAITRAKQGLIVLGNPWILEHDPYWTSFLHFCWRNGLWQMDPADVDDAMAEAQEKQVNDWNLASQGDAHLPGLERALIYKERQPVQGGSQAVRRFMSERGEDEIWMSGRLAEMALQDTDG